MNWPLLICGEESTIELEARTVMFTTEEVVESPPAVATAVSA